MTRINLVDPKVLSDKHLMAEYRELPRIFTAVAKNPDNAIKREKPSQYTLGTGHVIFFYDKLGWLYLRYCELHDELEARDFHLDYEMFCQIRRNAIDTITRNTALHTEYQPTPEEIYLNMARLAKRSNMPRVLEELDAD